MLKSYADVINALDIMLMVQSFAELLEKQGLDGRIRLISLYEEVLEVSAVYLRKLTLLSYSILSFF